MRFPDYPCRGSRVATFQYPFPNLQLSAGFPFASLRLARHFAEAARKKLLAYPCGPERLADSSIQGRPEVRKSLSPFN